jgi:hypothetical protein
MSYYSQIVIMPTSLSDQSNAIEKILAIFSKIIESSCDILVLGLQTCEHILATIPSDAVTNQYEIILTLFESSCLRSILPMIMSSFSLLYSQHSEIFLQYISPNMIQSIKQLSYLFNDIKLKLPLKRASNAILTSTRTIKQVYESDHPYKPNERKTFEINLPGSNKMTFTFDPQCRCETNCDYVRIWKDSSKESTWHPHLDKLTGRGSSMMWPGVEDQPPLEIDGSSAFVEFYSDGSDEDWGWKFEVGM